MNPLEDEESLSRRGFLVGTAGAAAAVGASGTALAQDEEDGGDGEEGDGGDGGEDGESEGEGGEGGGGGGTQEIVVGPGASPEFDPDSVSIPPGTEVVWTWDSDNHNVEPSSQPEDANWEGHVPTEDAGFEYRHTFEVEGEYEYICRPHIGQGMEGSITVDPDATLGGGGEGGLGETVPEAAWTLIIATTAGLVSVLSLAYGFMRYGGPTGE